MQARQSIKYSFRMYNFCTEINSMNHFNEALGERKESHFANEPLSACVVHVVVVAI